MLLRELWHAAAHHIDRLDRGLFIALEKSKLHPVDTVMTETGLPVDMSASNQACSAKLRALAHQAAAAGDYRQARNAVQDIETPKAQNFAAEMQSEIDLRTFSRKERFRRSFAILGAKVEHEIASWNGNYLDRGSPYKIAEQTLQHLAERAFWAGDLIQAYGALRSLTAPEAGPKRRRIKKMIDARYKPAASVPV
jgi:hypothetical protein